MVPQGPLHKHEPYWFQSLSSHQQITTSRNFQFLVKNPNPSQSMQPVMNPYPLVPKLGTNLLGLSWPPTSNPYHYKAFRLKVNQVGKYPTSWSLKKLPKTGVHALSSPCRTTSLLVSKESDGRMTRYSREKSDVLSLGFLHVWPLHLHSFLSTNSFPLFHPFCFSFPFSHFSSHLSFHFLFSFAIFSPLSNHY